MGREIEDVVIELVCVYNNMIADGHLLEVLRKSLVLGPENMFFMKLLLGGLKMSAEEVIDFKSDIIAARVDGMLCRAEEAGIQEGKMETAKNMLEDGFPIEKVVQITGLSKDIILNLK